MNWILPMLLNAIQIPIMPLKINVMDGIMIDFSINEMLTKNGDHYDIFLAAQFVYNKTNNYYKGPSTDLHQVISS